MKADQERSRTSPRPRRSSVARCLVAMPFRQDWSDVVYDVFERVMNSAKVDVFKVDTTNRTSNRLAQDVENQIEGADIVIADVTGANPNVHIEIGLAIASGKPYILCTQTSSDICAHLIENLYITYDTSKEGLEELERQVRLRIRDCLEWAQNEKERGELIAELAPEYDVRCFKDRTTARLETAFSQARHRIDILTTNLSWLFKNVPNASSTYWDHIAQALKRNQGLQLRILTLNPESEIAAMRGRQLGFTAANFRTQLRTAFDQARRYASDDAAGRIELRLYDELPTQIAFRIDENVYTCIVGQPMQSRNLPVLKFMAAQQGVEEAFLNHFLAVWKDAGN